MTFYEFAFFISSTVKFFFFFDFPFEIDAKPIIVNERSCNFFSSDKLEQSGIRLPDESAVWNEVSRNLRHTRTSIYWKEEKKENC